MQKENNLNVNIKATGINFLEKDIFIFNLYSIKSDLI